MDHRHRASQQESEGNLPVTDLAQFSVPARLLTFASEGKTQVEPQQPQWSTLPVNWQVAHQEQVL